MTRISPTMSESDETISIQDATLPLFAGVDVGGTSIKIGIVDDHGATLRKTRFDTEESRGPADAMERVADALRGLLGELDLAAEDLTAVGLGTPGSMDIPTGMILEPPNMPSWRNFPIRDHLSRCLDLPVGFANDANAAAFGEYWVGSGRDYRSMVMLTLGTGVGGGIIVDGLSIDGEHSFGSECGHMIVDPRPDARMCVWGGGQGQLEAYASASAVAQRAIELLAEGRESTVSRRISADTPLTTLMLFEEAELGDLFSQEVILEAADYLAVAVVSLVHIIDPGGVVIGGAMTFGGNHTKVGRMFIERVRAVFRERAYSVVQGKTVIDYAMLGGNAGYIGAAGIAREACSKGVLSSN